MFVYFKSEPAWSDGYAVRVDFKRDPIIKVKVAKSKYYSDPEDIARYGGPRSMIPTSDLVISEDELDALEELVIGVGLRVPVDPPRQYDGTWCTLVIGFHGPQVELIWPDGRMPSEWEAQLAPIYGVLRDFAARKGLAQPADGTGAAGDDPPR